MTVSNNCCSWWKQVVLISCISLIQPSQKQKVSCLSVCCLFDSVHRVFAVYMLKCVMCT